MKLSKRELLKEAKCELYMVSWYKKQGSGWEDFAKASLQTAKELIAEYNKRAFVEKLARRVNAFPKRISFGV
jgi:hypothetical protein